MAWRRIGLSLILQLVAGLACSLPALPGLSVVSSEATVQPEQGAALQPTSAADLAPPASPAVLPPTSTPDDPRDQIAVVRIQSVSNEPDHETVELVNRGTVPQLMDGWQLQGSLDDETLVDDFKFPAGFVLEPGATVKIHSGPGGVDAPPTDLFWTDLDVWDNAGETIYLYDAQLDLVDAYDWPPGAGQ
jgi:hypothetical protein